MAILKTLTENEKKLLRHRFYRKNEIAFHEGELCTCICVVINGSFDIVSYSYKGKEILYNSIRKDEMFGNNLILSSEPFYRGNVIAKKESEIAIIEQPTFLYLLRNNEAFLKEYLRVQSEFGKSLNAKIKLLSFSLAEERLNYYLLMHDGVVTYKYITTLAEQLNLTREVLSRLLTKLEKERKIKRTNKTIELIKK